MSIIVREISKQCRQVACAQPLFVGSSRSVTKMAANNKKLSSEQIFERESKYGAHNYHPLPVALHRGQGKETNMIALFDCNRLLITNYMFRYLFMGRRRKALL